MNAKILPLIVLIVSNFMLASIKVIQLAPERWEEYKALRLNALKKEPDAFAIAVEDEEIKSDTYWQEKLSKANAANDNWLYFAESEGKIVGMIGAFREYKEVTYCTHLVTIGGMYVEETMRGQGVADLLMKHVLAKIAQCNEPIVCMLWVTVTKKPAIKLYERNGFNTCGLLPKSVKIGNEKLDCFLMCKVMN